MPVRSSSPLITATASSVAGTSQKTPPYRPTGVRSGEQMTASRMRERQAVSEDEAVQGVGALDVREVRGAVEHLEAGAGGGGPARPPMRRGGGGGPARRARRRRGGGGRP